jgi:hypothetical protein
MKTVVVSDYARQVIATQDISLDSLLAKHKQAGGQSSQYWIAEDMWIRFFNYGDVTYAYVVPEPRS